MGKQIRENARHKIVITVNEPHISTPGSLQSGIAGRRKALVFLFDDNPWSRLYASLLLLIAKRLQYIHCIVFRAVIDSYDFIVVGV